MPLAGRCSVVAGTFAGAGAASGAGAGADPDADAAADAAGGGAVDPAAGGIEDSLLAQPATPTIRMSPPTATCIVAQYTSHPDAGYGAPRPPR